MKLLDLDQFSCFRESARAKVLRHKSTRDDLWALRRDGAFDRFQNGQRWDVFGKAEYVISFIAERHKYAKFVGVWKVFSKRQTTRGFLYRTKEEQGFSDLEGRLIVSWGDGTRSWAQWLHRQGNKKVVELLPPNYVMDFPGFYNFTLSYAQLTEMVKNPDSNREWQRMLSSVSGVYVLLDQRSGKQYIGSAYGSGGIWARWKSYVRNPTGGNRELKSLLKSTPGRCRQFQFSILRVLEPHASKDDVISQEVRTKHKLGSRAFGLNSN